MLAAGDLLLDRARSNHLPLLIRHRKSPFLPLLLRVLHVLGCEVCVVHCTTEQARRTVRSSRHLPHQGDFLSSSSHSNSIRNPSRKHSVSAILDQKSYEAQVLVFSYISSLTFPIRIAVCSRLVLHDYIVNNVRLAQGNKFAFSMFPALVTNLFWVKYQLAT